MRTEIQRDTVVTLSIVTLVFVFSTLPLYERIDAVSTDIMLYVKHHVFGQDHPPTCSPTVVIALDEQTYRTAPFANLPKVLWTPQIAMVQDSVLNAGAKVIGYDVIFPTSLEPFLPGYEKPFLL